MIDAIYSSKLYKASKRKSAIVAAANDPVNTELVTQLADALSPIYQKEEYLVDKEAEQAKAEAEKAREIEEDAKEEIEDISSEPSKEPRSKASKSHIADEFRKAEKHEKEDANEIKEIASEEKSEELVDNSTATTGEPITATRLIVTDMKQVVDQIKGLLNAEDGTAGVNRILVKDYELWIYYNDSINLNNVMANVIELLNAADYAYLEFNRLARSDNAIVFQILSKDTNIEVKPAECEETEQ